MPENRPNEDRYSRFPEVGPEFLADAKRGALQKYNREKNKDHLGRPFTPANSHGPNGPYKQNVIEKLTAPPETFLEHAERIGLNVNVNDIMSGDGKLLRRHYSIVFSEDELKKAEGR